MVHKNFCREPNPDFCTQIFRNDGRSWGRIMVRPSQTFRSEEHLPRRFYLSGPHLQRLLNRTFKVKQTSTNCTDSAKACGGFLKWCLPGGPLPLGPCQDHRIKL